MSRILNRQRQMAEQGRLRLGETVAAKNGGTRPVKSETWIVTSHSEEHVHAAAALWGGTPEPWQPLGNGAEQWRVKTNTSAIDAILPPGDPLSQAYELWSKGGCQRRCDGATEQLSGAPCVCLAQFGDRWHEQRKGTVCDSKSRLKVLLPDMPGLGVWRMETGSYYATDEIAGMVDVIREAVGDRQLVPVRLRIEQRTRVAGGETKQFVVPVVELRGVTAGALLSGQMERAAINGGQRPQQAAIKAAPTEQRDWVAEGNAATTLDQWREVWRDAANSPDWSPQLEAALRDIGKRLANGAGGGKGAGDGETQQASAPAGGSPAPAETAADPDAVWMQILSVAGSMDPPMTTDQVEADFASKNAGVMPSTASGGELQAYLNTLKEKGK